jgi:hypothetical protein
MHRKAKHENAEVNSPMLCDQLLAELKKQNVSLVVVSENALRVKGRMTLWQKENIKLWKSQIIELLSPKCSACALPMKIIEVDESWFCPLGCSYLQRKIDEEDFAEAYNNAVDMILSDSKMQMDFFTILDEQKAVMIIDGNVPETTAEEYICRNENLRRVASLFILK